MNESFLSEWCGGALVQHVAVAVFVVLVIGVLLYVCRYLISGKYGYLTLAQLVFSDRPVSIDASSSCKVSWPNPREDHGLVLCLARMERRPASQFLPNPPDLW